MVGFLEVAPIWLKKWFEFLGRQKGLQFFILLAQGTDCHIYHKVSGRLDGLSTHLTPNMSCHTHVLSSIVMCMVSSIQPFRRKKSWLSPPVLMACSSSFLLQKNRSWRNLPPPSAYNQCDASAFGLITSWSILNSSMQEYFVCPVYCRVMSAY